MIYGTRQSLVIALVAGLGATILSVLIGVSAAYLGGWADDVLSMFTDVFLVLPTFPLIIVLATYAGKGSLLVVIIVLIVTGWSFGARQLRAQALSLRNREFLESARVRGERSVVHHRVRGAADDDLADPRQLPRRRALLGADGGRPAVPRARRPVLDQLGHDALLGAEPAGAAAAATPPGRSSPGLCVALLGVSFALLNYAFDEISNPALRPVRRSRVKRAS